MHRKSAAALLFAITLVSAACSREEQVLIRRNPPAGVGTIRVEPPAATLLAGAEMPMVQAFEAYQIVDDRKVRITDKVRWSSDNPDIVRIDDAGRAMAVSAYGGEAIISAITAPDPETGRLNLGTARVHVKLSVTKLDEDVSPEVSRLFAAITATSAALAPELLYPLDGVMLPPNLRRLEIHFRPGRRSVLHEIAFTNDRTEGRLYVRCAAVGDGCVYEVPPAIWKAIVETNKGDRVTLVVRGTDEEGTATGASASHTLWIANENLGGTVYYFTTSNGTGIMRWNTADTGQMRPEAVLGPDVTKDCVGCHALTGDGTRLLVSSGMAGAGGRSLLYDLATKTTRFLNIKLQFAAFDPYGTQLVGVVGDGPSQGPKDLQLFDGRTGMQRGTVPVRGMRPTHPDWSSDGKRIVFTAVDLNASYPDTRPGIGGIAYIERELADWTSPRTVVSSSPGSNFYFPVFAPQGALAGSQGSQTSLVAFVESMCGANTTYHVSCDAESDPSARLWIAPVPMSTMAGRPRARPLDNANRPGPADQGNDDLVRSYPKWHPIPFTAAGRLVHAWLTYSSSRRFGLHPLPPSERKGVESGTLIWMTAINLSLGPTEPLAQGKDPSYAPFVLPYQDLSTSNHAAQWSVGP